MKQTLANWARRIAPLALLCIPLLHAAAQDRYAQMAFRYDGARLYHEAIVLPGSGLPQVLVAFRIPNSRLVFVQDGDEFVSEADVTVEIYREDEKVDDTVWRGVKRARTFEETSSDAEDIAGHVRFDLDPGTYAYRVTLAGGTDGSRGSAPRQPFDVVDFTGGGIGTPFFADVRRADSTFVELSASSLGGDAPFGRKVSTAVPMAFSGSDPRLAYRLYRLDPNGAPRGPQLGGRERASPGKRAELREDFELSREDRLLLEGSTDLESALPIGDLESDCLCWRAQDDIGRLALLDLGTDSLANGAYLLEVELRTDEETRTRRTFFQTHWRDMPLSLYDVDVAIRNLSFIESRDRIRSMLRGSRKDRIEAFRAYWDQRDPSPRTVVNELMQEYYDRIDYAASEFRTGRTPLPDGLRTDAARIYIVHGSPEDISNSFPSTGGVQQVWTYPDGRRFVFWAPSSLEPLSLEESVSGAAGENGSGS